MHSGYLSHSLGQPSLTRLGSKGPGKACLNLKDCSSLFSPQDLERKGGGGGLINKYYVKLSSRQQICLNGSRGMMCRGQDSGP